MTHRREASCTAPSGRTSGVFLRRLLTGALGVVLFTAQGCGEKSSPEPQTEFRLKVDRVFYVEGSDRVIVIGFVLSGSVKAGDGLTVRGGPASIPVTVDRLEHPERKITVARQGDQVALVLHGATKDQVHAGDLVASR